VAVFGASNFPFALVTGMDTGLAMVDAPGVRAVAFTGSQREGMTLVERAQRRSRPIPVYAEMGTVNPAIVTPAGAEHRLAEIIGGFVASATATLREALADSNPGHMLTAAMAMGYADQVDTLRGAGADVAGQGPMATSGFATAATVMSASVDDLQPDSLLLEECFGPLAIVVDYGSLDEGLTVIARLQPSLAASVLTSGSDDADTARLVQALTPQVGRVVVDGWPKATSVGAKSLDRFTRPIAFQDAPDAALPQSLRDDNPWGLPRRVDGSLVDGSTA